MSERLSATRSHLLTLQILTPITLCIAIVVLLVLSLIPPQSLTWINTHYVTIYTPSTLLLGIYWLILCIPALLYSVFLATTKTPTEFLHTPSFGVPILFLLYATWAIFMLTRLFLFSGVVVVIMLLIAGWNFLKYEYLGWGGKGLRIWLGGRLLIRLFFLVLLNFHFPHSLLLSFKWYTYIPSSSSPTPPTVPYEPAPDYPNHGSPGPRNPETREWIFFGVISAIGFIDAGIVFAGKDFVWTLGCIYLWIAVLFGKGERPAQVLIPLILLSVLLVVAFFSSLFWEKFDRRREGRIRLEDGENGDANHVETRRDQTRAEEEQLVRPPREVQDL